MIFIERYKKILKSKKDLENEIGEICIENNIIVDIDILITGHFGNTVSISMLCDSISPLPLYNSTGNIGFIIRALVELFDKENDDPVSIKKLNNTPIRLVFKGNNPWGSSAVAIGHYMKDRFVLIDELMKIKE